MNNDLRPCLVWGRRAMFHKWVEETRIISPSLLVGGHDGGVIKQTYALIENQYGKIEMVCPQDIEFVDDKVKVYFEENF